MFVPRRLLDMVRPRSLALVTLSLWLITIYNNKRKLGLILYKRYPELLTLVAIVFDSILRRPLCNHIRDLLRVDSVLQRKDLAMSKLAPVTSKMASWFATSYIQQWRMGLDPM